MKALGGWPSEERLPHLRPATRGFPSDCNTLTGADRVHTLGIGAAAADMPLEPLAGHGRRRT